MINKEVKGLSISSLTDKDPCAENYLALYISIIWYRYITADEAIRIIEGRSNMKKMAKRITPEMRINIRKTVSSPYFTNMDRLCRKYGLSELEIKGIIAKDIEIKK